MRERVLVEMVCRQVDQLDDATDDVDDCLSTSPGYRRDLKPLRRLIRRLKSALLPAEPSPQFKESLRADLLRSWHEQKRREAAQASVKRRDLLIRVAAFGSFVSAATLCAVIARSRRQGKHVA